MVNHEKTWFEEVKEILSDCVGFIYRMLPWLQARSENFSYSHDPLGSLMAGGTNLLIGLTAFVLLPISAMMPAALVVFLTGADAHISHTQTRHHYGLSDADYAALSFSALLDEKSTIESSYDPMTGQRKWEREIRLPTGRKVRTRMTNQFYRKLEKLKSSDQERFQRALEMRRRFRDGRIFKTWPQMTPPLLPSEKIVFSHALAAYVVDSHEESMSQDVGADPKETQVWRSDGGVWTLFWMALLVPLGTFGWMRFWILGLFLTLFKLIPGGRADALTAFSEETRNTWSSFFMGYYLLPVSFGLLYMLVTGFSMPKEIGTALAYFYDNPETLWPVSLMAVITSLMVSTAFYRAVEWLCKGLIIGALGRNPRLVGFVVTNLVAFVVLLTVEIALPAVLFALATAAYLEVHPRLMARFADA